MKPITNTELDFMNILWHHAPVGSTQLVRLAQEQLGWKKSTTYTVIKNLAQKGYLVNRQAVVTPLAAREDLAVEQGEAMLSKVCGGSVQLFLASFLQREKLTPKEARELKEIIDRHTREDG